MTKSDFQTVILAEIARRDLNTAQAARLMEVPYDTVRDLHRRENYRPNVERAQQMLAKLGLSDANPPNFVDLPSAATAHSRTIDPRGETAPLGHNDMRVNIADGQLVVNAAVTKRMIPQLIKLIEGAANALPD
jgi:predicted XRE-type DNA-binding protein